MREPVYLNRLFYSHSTNFCMIARCSENGRMNKHCPPTHTIAIFLNTPFTINIHPACYNILNIKIKLALA